MLWFLKSFPTKIILSQQERGKPFSVARQLGYTLRRTGHARVACQRKCPPLSSCSFSFFSSLFFLCFFPSFLPCLDVCTAAVCTCQQWRWFLRFVFLFFFHILVLFSFSSSFFAMPRSDSHKRGRPLLQREKPNCIHPSVNNCHIRGAEHRMCKHSLPCTAAMQSPLSVQNCRIGGN